MNDSTRVFAQYRRLLFTIVYDMLGSAADAEDVVQDTWLAWSARRAAPGEITHPRAYLVRMAVNGALSRRASIDRRRETYIGPWLPEPLLETGSGDTADSALPSESVSMAMLVVLETLTPLERAVFVLHEVFGYPHTDIATMLDRTPAAIRQLAHRAREHVRARRPRYRADARTQQRVTERFLAAQREGDIDALLELLAPEVTMWTDSNGAHSAARHPILGSDKVIRLLTGPRASALVSDLDITYDRVNGDPAAVVRAGGTIFAVAVLDIDPETERIRGIYAVANPDKLSHARSSEPGSVPGPRN